ncbi:ABC transporter substrate-binding protein [Miniphocaeibacter massiliensis]|uniref:ABC transporter substrate-binding protein n=1 Tax=Miniphocaeibacter massiliensis TaxID=2041841 RepID=UPI001F5D8C24|nr:ABC transporter substrate-binding protein [Miniphocaeibacter massiliensis]
MKMLKKLLAIGLTTTILLTGCSSGGNKDTEGGSKNKKDGKYVVGINQLMEHQALDDAREGFKDGLKELGVEAKVDIEFKEQNAQGDHGVASQIAEKFIGDKVDLIYTIATPATQATATAIDKAGTDTPIVFSAVTDAVESGLIKENENPGGNITGVLDAADVKAQLELYKELDSKIKTIGIIYNTSEENSAIQVKQVEEIAPEVGLKVKTTGINSINDMAQSLQTLLDDVDALYVISDNMVASSVELVNDALIEKKMISICAEESQVSGGILLSNGSKYYDMGKEAAQKAKEILIDGKNPGEIPVELGKTKSMKVNETTLKELGLKKDLPIFKDAEFVK